MPPVTRSMTKGSLSQSLSEASSAAETNVSKVSYTSEGKDGNSMGSTCHSTSNSSSTSNTTSVTVTNASTIEEQLASLTKVIECLTRKIQDQNLRISNLMNNVDTDNACQINGKQVEENDDEETSTKHLAAETEQTARELQISVDRGL
ncbi:hypothetical protein ACS0TY_003117 [Phlomoides rotata]